MKLRLNKTLKRALLMSMMAIASVSSSSLADVYVCAEGVNYEIITDSERFYDHAKGWSIFGGADVRETVNKKYQETGSFEFLGELADRLPEGITSVTYDSFSELINDSMLCWAFAATNQIEYWQSYYGVLYTGDRELPYGYTYNPEELADLRGVLSLNVGMLFYDNWKDLGGWGSHAFEWYFNGNDTYSELTTTGNGGFWKGQITSVYRGFSTSASMDSIKSTLLESLGYQKNSAGDYEATEIGRISQLSIRYYNSTSGHAITCYGLVLDDDGALKGILVADSDNSQYGLTTYYLKKNDEGYAFLYTDEECTRMYGRYYLEGTYYFKTSSALKDALSSYYDAETPLVWTGNSEVWASNATLETLPDEESGWSVTVGNETYHSFFHDNRKVKFSDNASSTDVQVVGNLQVSELLLENSQYTYSFVDKGKTSISANLISATGAGTAVLSGLDITANRVSCSGYHLVLESGTLLTTQSLELGNYAVLGLGGAVLNAAQMTLGADSRLEIIDGGSVLELGVLNFDSSATLYIGADLSSTPILTLSGNFVGNGLLEVLFSEQLTLTEESYTLFQLEGNSSIWQDVFTSSQGDFEIINGILYFNPARILTWTSGDGIWSCSTWNGEPEETNAKSLVINKNGDLNITVQGLVTADSLTVSNEEGVVFLESADAASMIGGDLSIIKKNGGILVLSGANTFCGDISLMGGVLEAVHGQAFGSGDVFVSGGTVKMNGYACPNLLNISGDASLMGGGAYAGQLYLRKGNLTGDALNLANNAMVMSGSISNVLMGDGGVIKSESGVVTLSGANSYTGGTLVTAGELIAMHDSALGRGNISIENAKLTIGAAGVSNSISVSGNSYISVVSGTVWNVASPIENSGSLTLSGSIQADALTLTTISSGRVDAYGKYGNNGFAVNAAHSYFVLVDGGKNQTSGLTLTHSGIVYTLKENGVAVSGDGNYINYATYQANAGHAVRISEAQQAAGGLLNFIQLRGGVLYADADINNVNAQGGTIYLEGGEMKGYLSSATVYATGGTIAASMSNATSFTASGNVVLDSSSNNSHTGGTFLNGGNFKICHPNFFGNGVITTTGETTMNSLVENFEGLSNKATNIRYVIQNSGTLTMLGVFNVSALPLITTDNQYIDSQGKIGESGFLLSSGSCVKLVEGGSLIADATVMHGNLTLVLNNDGYAYENNQLSDYKRYFLNGEDSVRVSTAMAYSSEKLEDVIMTGGTLYADTSIKVSTTGGLVELSEGTLLGSIANARVNATGGVLAAELSGSTSVHATQGALTLSGANTHTGINSFKDGTFRFTNASALGSGIVETSGNTTLQADSRVTLTTSIRNSGALTIQGELNFSSDVPIVYGYQTYLDVDNRVGTSGFLVEIPRMVRIVEGGDVHVDQNNTKLFLNGSRIYHWKDGMAYITTMAIYSSTYVLNSGDSVLASEAIASVDDLFFAVTFQEMEVNGGLLESDADIMVNGKGGTIHLTAGDLSGVIQDTILQTEAGTLSATLRGTTSLEATGTLTLSGDNTHTGDNVLTDATITLNHANALGSGSITTTGKTSLIISEKLALHHVISNTGLLEVNGCIDASNLSKIDSTWQYRDVNGSIGRSGFVEQVGARILVVNGGMVLGNAQVIFGDSTYILGSDGYAVSADENNKIDYEKYYLNGTDSVSVSEAEAASSDALTSVSMSGGSLYADASTRVTSTGGHIILSSGLLRGSVKNASVSATGGTLSAVLSDSSSLIASGAVTISGANSHTGGTLFNGGTFTLSHASALGAGSVVTQGSNTLTATTPVRLSSTILNSGSLTLSGAFDASALTLTTQSASYVDAAGNTSTSGFQKAGAYQVQVVNGGTVNGNVTITHGGNTLTLGSNGCATMGGAVDYRTYHLQGTDSVSVSEAIAASGGVMSSISMSGGTLHVDGSMEVRATGGLIQFTSGSLSGSVSGDATISASDSGRIASANTHTGGIVFNGGSFSLAHAAALGNGTVVTMGTTSLETETTVALKGEILNSGDLRLSGAFDVSSLALNVIGAGYVDATGNASSSGFVKATGYNVQVVNGGTVSGTATFQHGSYTLTLDSNGRAVLGGGVAYDTYYLNSGDVVSASAAKRASANALSIISMSGGNLYADTSIGLNASGGQIQLMNGTLSGAVRNATITAREGIISAELGGTSRLLVQGKVKVSGNNTYTGGTVLNEGVLEMMDVHALGRGNVTLVDGRLRNAGSAPTSITAGMVTLKGAVLEGQFTLDGCSGWDVRSNTEIQGSLALNGGLLQLHNSALTVSDALILGNATIELDASYVEGNTYTLLSAGNISGSVFALELQGASPLHCLKVEGNTLVLKYMSEVAPTGSALHGGNLTKDDKVVIEEAGSIVLEGSVAPGAITVTADKNITLSSNNKTSGSLTGDGNLSKSGGGTLTLNEDNSSWTGDTCLNGGGIKVKGENSLGQGDVYVKNGTLDLSSKAVGNDIVQTGTGIIKGGMKFTGTYTLEEGGELMKGSALDISTTATLSGGVVSGTLTGSGLVNVTGAVTLSDMGKISTNALNVSDTGILTVSSKGVSLNTKTSAISLNGGSIVTQGKLSCGELDIANGGSLATNNIKPVSMTFQGGFEANGLRDENGEIIRKSTINIYGGFAAASLNLTDSEFRLGMNSLSRNVNTPAKAQIIQIKGKQENNILDASELVVAGRMSVTGNLGLKNNSFLSLYDPSGKNAAMPLAVKGALTMSTYGELSLNGKLSAASMCMTDSDIILSNEKAQSITLSGKSESNELTRSSIMANASMNVTGDIRLTDSIVSLRDASMTKPKAMGLTVKGVLDISDSRPDGVSTDWKKDEEDELLLSGRLSAGSLTMENADIKLENEQAAQSIALTLAKDTRKQVVVNTITNSTIDATGSMTVAGALALTDSSISLHDVDFAAKPKAMGLTVKDALSIADTAKDATAELTLTGKLSAARLTLDKADITLENTTAAQSIALTLAKDTQKQVVVNSLTTSTIDVTGSMTVAGALALTDSSIYLHDVAGATKPKAMGLTVKGDMSMLSDSNLTLSGKLSANSLQMVDSAISLLAATAQGITLSGKNITNEFTNSDIYANGSMSVTGNLSLKDSGMSLVDDSFKPKAQTLTVKGALDITDADRDAAANELYLTGKLTAGSLNMTNADIRLENEQAAQSISLTMAKDAQKQTITNTLTDSSIYANGNMSVTGNLSLLGASYIHLEDKAKGKAMNLAVKGDLTLGSGSSLTLSGALSAANMTLNGGSINLTSTKLQTIKVSQTLTLNAVNSVVFNFDAVDGKKYKLFTFKSLDAAGDVASLLGWADNGSYELAVNAKDITLTVVDATAWMNYMDSLLQNTTSEVAVASVEESEPGTTTSAAVEEEQTEEQQEATVITTLPVVHAVDVEELIAKVSDTLVQTTWGTAKASRAFVDSIANRGQNATALAEGRGAAWGGVIGATSRLSSHGGSLGADHTLSGAVFGAEMNASAKHSLGMAMGVTWGEINTLSAYNVDQDSTHFALYGQSRLMQNGKKGLTLDWSAAYGRSENDADMLGCSYDWTQHALQLDARLTYGYALNERTTLRGFGGVQYLHIDSDTPEKGVKADSMQNVRVEVGVGATYMATAKTAVYGEVSFIGDMVRDNPATHIGGVCRGGSNPGRAGMNLSVGATHALNESWSLNASYNMELQPRANAHNANVGATYRF